MTAEDRAPEEPARDPAGPEGPADAIPASDTPDASQPADAIPASGAAGAPELAGQRDEAADQVGEAPGLSGEPGPEGHAEGGQTPEGQGGAPGEPEPPLPEPVRQRVIALAAVALSGLPVEELPVPLRRIAKFAPNRRARLGGPSIATQITGDPLFRQRIAKRVLADAGELGAAVIEGACPAAADPVEVAALAYLARPNGWAELVASASEAVRAEADSAALAELIRDAEQRVGRAEHERAAAKVEADKLRDELARLRAEAAQLRDEVRTLTRGLREAERAERRAAELLATEKGRISRANADHDAELRRLKTRLADAEGALDQARQSTREARAADDARLWLLLETIQQAAHG